MVALGFPAIGYAQSGSAAAMVVDIPQDDLYHNPACPLVRAAGSKVKVMRQGEAARRRLKPHDCAIGDGGAAVNPNVAPVYVQAGDSRYHKEGCKKLTPAATKTTLAEAGQKHWPCGTCKPPRRKPVVQGQP
jgi:hypothetical protein